MRYFLTTVLFQLLIFTCLAQNYTQANYRNWIRGTTDNSRDKIAFVIGNSDYQYTTRLAEPANDANTIAEALIEQGYEVELGFNLDRATFLSAINDFAQKLPAYKEGIIFYAGHGMQVSGVNYLVPTDANPTAAWQVNGNCINVRDLLYAIDQPTIPKLILVDACRNNPFVAQWSSTDRSNAGQGMLAIKGLENAKVIFSTAEGTLVNDRNPFAEVFAEQLRKGGVS